MEPMNNFTPRAQQVLALARKEADRFNHNYVGTEHLLLGLIKLGQGVAVSVLQKMGLDLETVRAEVEKQVGSRPGDQDPRRQHPLHAPREEGPRPRRQGSQGPQPFLRRHRAHPPRPAPRGRRRRRPRAQDPRGRHRAHPQRDPPRTRSQVFLRPEATKKASRLRRGGSRPPQRRPGDKKEVKTPALKAFGRDLTELARKGEMDPVVGRQKEIAASSRSSAAAPRTTPCSSARPGWARPPSSKASRRKSPRATCPRSSRQESHHPRPRPHGRRHQIPRPVRGAHQGRDGRDQARQERHHLHRRAPHHRRCRRRRGRHGRLQHLQARPQPRRAPVHRRDHAQRIPQVHREGLRARAPLPVREGRGPLRGRHHPHPQGHPRQIRGAPQGHLHRQGPRDRREALRPLHHRPFPARQGHRRDGRGRLARPHHHPQPAHPRSRPWARRSKAVHPEGAGHRRPALRGGRQVSRPGKAAPRQAGGTDRDLEEDPRRAPHRRRRGA
jgi:hypothetical protein